MFFFLSKTIYLLVMPITWVFLMLLFAIFTKKNKKKRLYLTIGVLWLFITSNPYISTRLMKAWEMPAKPYSDYNNTYKTAIILGGVTDINKLPRDRVFTKQGADRILHAAELFKKGKVEKLLVTGGNASKKPDIPSEAFQMKKILLQCGIPDSLILIEPESINTRENAIKSASLLEQEGLINEKHILVTSAFHMRRSLGCFEKVGIKVDGFSTDFYTSDGRLNISFLEVIYPTEDSLNKTQRVFREILGYIVYKVMGYA